MARTNVVAASRNRIILNEAASFIQLASYLCNFLPLQTFYSNLVEKQAFKLVFAEFCGMLRIVCGILREMCGMFAEFYGMFAEFCGILRIVCGMLRNCCGILRNLQR